MQKEMEQSEKKRIVLFLAQFYIIREKIDNTSGKWYYLKAVVTKMLQSVRKIIGDNE